tara:strand:+ start:734 stop:1111 length:378 start_codon:yes stop_codon:yes gene_type:complete
MSTLKVTTIQTSAGGAVTLTKQSAAKVFSYYDQADGSGTLEKSLNVSSADDDGTGKQGINFTSNMSDAVYAVAGFNEDGVGENDAIGIHRDDGQTRSASEFNYLCMSGTSKNEGKSSLQVYGDLA